MNLSTESIIRSSKSSITNFISQSGHRFGKKTLKIWKSVFFIPYYLHSPPYYLILSVQQFLIIYLSFYVFFYLSINLFIYHTLFLSPFSHFSNLSIFLPVSRSFPLSMFLFLSLFLPFLTLSLPLSVFTSSPFSL